MKAGQMVHVPPICNVCGGSSHIVIWTGVDMRQDERRAWYRHADKCVRVSWVCGGTYRNKCVRWDDRFNGRGEYHGLNYSGDVARELVPHIHDYVITYQLHDEIARPWRQTVISKEQFDEYVSEWLSQYDYTPPDVVTRTWRQTA